MVEQDTPTLEEVRSRLVENLRRVVSEPHPTLFPELAEDVVAFRRHFRWEGRVDWAARSPEYQDAIRAVYREAGVPPESQSGFQAALRYHVNKKVKADAPPEDLEALGLKLDDPVKSARKVRARKREERQAGVMPRGMGPYVVDRRDAPRYTGDPATLVGLALDVVRVIRAQAPTGVTATALIPLLVRLQVDTAELIAECSKNGVIG